MKEKEHELRWDTDKTTHPKSICQLPDALALLDALEMAFYVAVPVRLYPHVHRQIARWCPKLSFQADLLVTGFIKEGR